MVLETSAYYFKGDPFINLYRIEGTLEAQSPVHIGTGESYLIEEQIDKGETERNNQDEKHHVDEVHRDFQGMPYIPGSSLRGVLRHYLLSLFRGFGSGIASNPDFESSQFREMTQEDKIAYMQHEASLLEQLFGTPFCESKIEFWDAPLVNKINNVQYHDKGWDSNRQTYVVRSVVIDPVTGAAERNKLFAFDVVPPGLKFKVNIAGRNLSDVEIGMLLFALEGFNSPIFPVTIGAMSGRGFGRMWFTLDGVYRLTGDDLPQWVSLANSTNGGGYSLLSGLKLSESDTKDLVKEFKSEFEKRVKEADL